MNSPTSRCTTPAAAPRTGRGESALPRLTGEPRPNSPSPPCRMTSARIPASGARTKPSSWPPPCSSMHATKPSCSPTNARLAQDLGCCEQTVRTALAHLQAAGWIRIVLGAHQPNGRTIWLLWRGDQIPQDAAPRAVPRQVSDTPQPIGPLPQPAGPPPQPIGPKVRRREDQKNVT